MKIIENDHQRLILEQNGIHIQKERVKIHHGMSWWLITLLFWNNFCNVIVKQHFRQKHNCSKEKHKKKMLCSTENNEYYCD